MNWCRVLVKVTVPILGNGGWQSTALPPSLPGCGSEFEKEQALRLPFLIAASAALSCLFQHVVWLLCQVRHVILLGFLHIRADVNTLTHEKYVPQSFYVLVVRVRKIVIITRNCAWVNTLLHGLRGSSLLLVLEIRFCLLLFVFLVCFFFA